MGQPGRPQPAGLLNDPDGYAQRVLRVVECVPAGRVLTYGDVADIVGEAGPRQVGRVLALWGGAVPWWRVVRADGTHHRALAARAAGLLAADGLVLREGRLDLGQARWRPEPGDLPPL